MFRLRGIVLRTIPLRSTRQLIVGNNFNLVANCEEVAGSIKGDAKKNKSSLRRVKCFYLTSPLIEPAFSNYPSGALTSASSHRIISDPALPRRAKHRLSIRRSLLWACSRWDAQAR
jgi:hypothetical protein